ncbi:MAG: AroM family protein [Sedimentibacter sp.]|uniref:AroM family protein n=1 Tax=Sedimentibacter sp. TaxID=1960295 RepID=UPI003158EFEA
MKKVRIGTVTIGQSPRTDITDEISPMLGERFVLVEKGALDGMHDDYIAEHIAPGEKDEVLVSRMQDGRPVRIAKDKVLPLIQEKIHELDKENVDIIVLLCNEVFPEFQSRTLLFRTEEVLHSMAARLAGGRNVGVMMPDRSQLQGITELWKKYGVCVKAVGASPYQEDSLEEEAEKLRGEDICFIFMECLGYSREMKKKVEAATGKMVLTTRTLMFRIIQEMF